MIDETPRTLVIESYEPSLNSELEALASRYPDEIHLVTAKGFSSSNYTVQALIPLVPILTGALAVIGTWIRSKRHMSVKIEGLEITGMSPNEVARVVRDLRVNGDMLEALGIPLPAAADDPASQRKGEDESSAD